MDNFDLIKYLAEGKLKETFVKLSDKQKAKVIAAAKRGEAPEDVVDSDFDGDDKYLQSVKALMDKSKLNEEMFDVATTEKIAQAVADAFTAEDNELDLRYVVNPDISEKSFDLDVERGPNTPDEDSLGQDIENYLGDYAGGSFYIRDGVVYNAAMRNAPVANVTPEGGIEMISAEDSRAALGMVDGEKTDYMERRREMSDYMEEGAYDNNYSERMAKIKQAEEDRRADKISSEEFAKIVQANIQEAGGDAQLMPSDPIVGFSQVASEFKDKLENNPQIDKIADMIIAKMSAEDKEAFVQKFKGKDEKNIFNMAMAMLKGLDEAVVDRDSAAGKFVALLGNLAGINLMALGGSVLGVFIGKVLLGIAVPVIPALISLVVSLIIRNVAGKLLGKDPKYTGLAGLEENKEKKSNKMKKSELKEMIKAAMLNEASEFDTNKPARIEAFLKSLDDLVDEYHAELYLNDDLSTAIEDVKSAAKAEMGGPVDDIPGFEGTMDALDSLSIREEKKDDKEEDVEDEEIDVEIDQDEEVDMDMDMDMDMGDEGEVGLTGDKKVVDDSLEAALEAARSLGDEKLVDQIGNTITFFTRSQIVKEEKEKMLQETKRMQRIAGIIK